jgi:hypothetical protein
MVLVVLASGLLHGLQDVFFLVTNFSGCLAVQLCASSAVTVVRCLRRVLSVDYVEENAHNVPAPSEPIRAGDYCNG